MTAAAASAEFESLLHCIEYSDTRRLRDILERHCARESAQKWFAAHDSSLPMRVAIRVGNVETVQLLLAHGADPSEISGQSSPLCLAAVRGALPIAQALLDAGAPCDPALAVRPLTLAARHGSLSVVRLLLGAGAALSRAGDAVTPLAGAVEAGGHDGIAILQALVDAGADLCASAGRLRPRKVLVHSARDAAMLRHLLDRGLNTDAPDEFGRTALLLACSRGDEAMARMLILAGANVDAVDRRGGGAMASLRCCASTVDSATTRAIRLMLIAAGCTTSLSADDLRHFWEPLTSMDARERAAAVALRREADAVRCALVRERALQLAIGLQAADLPVLVTLAILDECFYLQFAQQVAVFRKWAWLKHVKHWRQQQEQR